MSVANLEAFALQQGITKAFDKMSQGEQTLLRYQYLMQATADAQGDFARTSDGYANGLRLLESNIYSIKTRMGQVLIPILASATTSLNDFLGSLTQERPQTVLDQFNQIDIDTAGKLAKIQETADNARALIGVLGELDNTDASGALRNIASGANVLKADAPGTWQSLLNAVSNTTGIKDFGTDASGAAVGIEELASALAGTSDKMTKTEAWNVFLTTLGENADALSALTGKSAEETQKWLADIADAANKLSPDSAGAWNTLLSYLVKGLPGLENTEAGKAFFDSLAQNFLAMGSESEQAKAGLTALGWSTDQINERQAQWLETCKRLVQTIPGLSEIINTETGEVQGGTKAIEEHVTAWQQAQEKIIMWEAYYAKESALLNSQTRLGELRLDVIGAEQAAKIARAKLDEIRKKYGLENEEGVVISYDVQQAYGLSDKTVKEYNQSLWDLQEAEGRVADTTANLRREEEANAKATRDLQNIHDGLIEKYGEMEKAADGAANATDKATESVKRFDDETAKAAQESIKDFETALKSLTDYTEKAYQSSRQSITNALGGFAKMVTPAEQARQKVQDVQKEIAKLQKAGKSTQELELKMTGYNEAVPTIQNITAGLKSQVEYLQQYIDNIAKMRALGFSDDVLAMVSDGSAQSADYAAELATAGASEVAEINKQVAEVKAKTAELATSLTENNLAVDETMQTLVQNYADALEELNQYDGAKANAAQTVQGIVDGLGENAAAVQSQVNSILSMLAELSNASYGYNMPGVNFNSTTGGGSTTQVHTTINLDGTKLADAISTHQADGLKNLQRSGWAGGDMY